jgi:hypothetical protein
MNRARAPGYGDGLRGVIMRPGQFSAWNSVTGYAGGEQGQDMARMTPSGDAYTAADTLIGGQYNDPTGGATHYYNPSISQPNWGMENGGDWTRIGDHVFGNADAGRATQAQFSPSGGILSNEAQQMDQPQQRQGLLGSLGIQRRDPSAQGETSQPFYNRQSFGDTLARIAPALGRMGVMGLEGPAQAALDTRNQQQGEERAQAARAGRVNQTIEWMRSQPNGEQFAAMAEAVGVEPALQAMQAANAAPSQTSNMQNYNFLISQGMDPQTAMGRAFSGGTTINTGDVGTGQYLYGADAGMPAGWRVNIETGEASPTPGGNVDPAATDALASAGAVVGSTNVLTTVNDLRAAIEQNPGTTTGLFGSLLQGVPGSQAYDARATASTIRANLAFDQLSAMRAASPTGGALGSVSAPELALLESSIANLDLGQSTDQVLRSINTIEQQYTRILTQAYATGDPAALDALLGGRPSFLEGGTTPSAGGGGRVMYDAEGNRI